MVVRYESHKSCGREGSYRVDFSADQTQPLLAFVVRFFSISSTSTMEEIFPSDKARLEAMTSVPVDKETRFRVRSFFQPAISQLSNFSTRSSDTVIGERVPAVARWNDKREKLLGRYATGKRCSERQDASRSKFSGR